MAAPASKWTSSHNDHSPNLRVGLTIRCGQRDVRRDACRVRTQGPVGSSRKDGTRDHSLSAGRDRAGQSRSEPFDDRHAAIRHAATRHDATDTLRGAGTC
jgi:hypothetical protein